MSDFVGRVDDLKRLDAILDVVRNGESRLVAVRGRRQVGKSRLITEFVRRADLPQLFVTASLQATALDDLDRVGEEVARSSTLPGREVFTSNPPRSWDGALRLIAAALPSDGPAIVVLDEFPWFLRRDPGLEGTMQVVWDRVFEHKSVLLVLVGSDLAMMEALSTHGQPLFGRTKELTVRPFHPFDTAAILRNARDGAEVLDFQLVTGGFPRLLGDASGYASAGDYVVDQLADEHSSLCVNAARVLDAELPNGSQISLVLRAIGSGERTFRNLAKASGLADMVVQRALAALIEKRLVARDLPASVPPAEHPRYRIDDPYLRLWLALVDPGISDIERGRHDLAVDRFERSWPSWRGRAIEPLVRGALLRLAADDDRLGGATHVSGWWRRKNQREIDLVGVDRETNPTSVSFIGSIKWRENVPFGTLDARALEADGSMVPGVGPHTPRVAVARVRVDANSVVGFTAEDLIAAWKPS